MDAEEQMALDLDNAQTKRYAHKELPQKVNFWTADEQKIYEHIQELRRQSHTFRIGNDRRL